VHTHVHTPDHDSNVHTVTESRTHRSVGVVLPHIVTGASVAR